MKKMQLVFFLITKESLFVVDLENTAKHKIKKSLNPITLLNTDIFILLFFNMLISANGIRMLLKYQLFKHCDWFLKIAFACL